MCYSILQAIPDKDYPHSSLGVGPIPRVVPMVPIPEVVRLGPVVGVVLGLVLGSLPGTLFTRMLAKSM